MRVGLSILLVLKIFFYAGCKSKTQSELDTLEVNAATEGQSCGMRLMIRENPAYLNFYLDGQETPSRSLGLFEIEGENLDQEEVQHQIVRTFFPNAVDDGNLHLCVNYETFANIFGRWHEKQLHVYEHNSELPNLDDQPEIEDLIGNSRLLYRSKQQETDNHDRAQSILDQFNSLLVKISKKCDDGSLCFHLLKAKNIFNLPNPPPPPAPVSAVRSSYSGMASWYGPGFHGRRAASGESFNQYAMTAAHRTLPFGTQVRVTNLNNNRQVVVRINDRGPYSHGRIIDLSAAAAGAIGLRSAGVGPVQIEVLN